MSSQGFQPVSGNQALRLLFGTTVFLSAFLLFQVQPIVSKAILPWFGGTPGVWTTCMLVFQWLLFAGYAYAHLAILRLSAVWQSGLQSVALAAAVAVLPMLPESSWKEMAADQPLLAVVGILITCVGIPFFLLSTTSPLLQTWFAQTHHGESPYRLYALSNAGSLLALLTYPFVVEPALSLQRQSQLWSGCFAVYAVLCGVVAWWSLRFRRSVATRSDSSPTSGPSPSWWTVLLWFTLAAIPSAMMLATTNQVCIEVAPIPFLWIVPLALYLVSFIVCFESSRWYSPGRYTVAFAAAAILITVILLRGAMVPIVAQVAVFFGGFFCCAMLCHGELSRLKPAAQFLGWFYLVLAAGGATGGAPVSVVSPFLFNSYVEIHVATIATLALVLWISRRSASEWGRESLPVKKRFATTRSSEKHSRAHVVSARWWFLLLITVGVTIGLVYGSITEQRDVVHSLRNFYGVIRVKESVGMRLLYHGRILHGAQYLSAEKRRSPTTYFGNRTGVGLVMRHYHADRPRRIGIVGMGVGTLAAYGSPGDVLRFYELDADVARIAHKHFTFLQDCPATLEVVLGDARLSLEAERDRGEVQEFDVLAIDAFSGDAIPVHLLTREAIEIYLQHTRADGILAFHVSNSHFDLRPVLAAHARQARLAARIVAAHDQSHGEPPSIWILMARQPEIWTNSQLGHLSALEPDRETAWSDDYSSMLAVLKQQDLGAMLNSEGDHDIAEAGVNALQRNDLDAAEQAFRISLQRDRGNAGTWLHLGNTMRRKGDRRDAILCYQRAIELDGNYSEAHNNLGALLLTVDAALAERHIRQAIQLDPRNAEAYCTLGNILALRGELGPAVTQYEHALAINPTLRSAQQNLQIAQEQMK